MCNVLFGENEVINVKCNRVSPIILGNVQPIRMQHPFPGPSICHQIWILNVELLCWDG